MPCFATTGARPRGALIDRKLRVTVQSWLHGDEVVAGLAGYPFWLPIMGSTGMNPVVAGLAGLPVLAANHGSTGINPVVASTTVYCLLSTVYFLLSQIPVVFRGGDQGGGERVVGLALLNASNPAG